MNKRPMKSTTPPIASAKVVRPIEAFATGIRA
jgi:hypothetical protein